MSFNARFLNWHSSRWHGSGRSKWSRNLLREILHSNKPDRRLAQRSSIQTACSIIIVLISFWFSRSNTRSLTASEINFFEGQQKTFRLNFWTRFTIICGLKWINLFERKSPRFDTIHRNFSQQLNHPFVLPFSIVGMVSKINRRTDLLSLVLGFSSFFLGCVLDSAGSVQGFSFLKEYCRTKKRKKKKETNQEIFAVNWKLKTVNVLYCTCIPSGELSEQGGIKREGALSHPKNFSHRSHLFFRKAKYPQRGWWLLTF